MATVLITGAKRGIGFDVARRLAGRGHRVFATVYAPAEVGPLQEALREFGDRVTVEKLDIRDAGDRAKAASWDVDVLVNNAAIGDSGPLLEIDVDRIRRTFETNVFATLELTQAMARAMVERGRKGRVVLVGSMVGLVPMPYLAPYGMTKFALENVAYSLRAELAPFSIKVIMVNPGAYGTGFNKENIDRKYEWLSSDSRYRRHEKEVRKWEAAVLKLEVRDTASIAKKIVQAVESPRPRKRYAAPWWQWIFVPFARWLG